MAPTPIDLAQLLAVIDDPRSVSDLRTYFGTGLPSGVLPSYTGGRFELLGGGGERHDVADRITADDLIAVQMLNVLVPGEVALDLLEGDFGRAVAAQLARIPSDITIAAPVAESLLADGGPADTAWRLLREPDGMGWVTTGKLLARKRPQLVPVYDRVVRCAFGHPLGAWLWLHGLFTTDGGALHTRLLSIRDAAGIPARVSALRVLDVIVWMRHRCDHRLRGCPGLSR
jgi:hypothetical protein